MDSFRKRLSLVGLNLDIEHENDPLMPSRRSFDTSMPDDPNSPSAQNTDVSSFTKPKKCAFFYLDGIKYTIGNMFASLLFTDFTYSLPTV